MLRVYRGLGFRDAFRRVIINNNSTTRKVASITSTNGTIPSTVGFCKPLEEQLLYNHT